MDLALAAYFNLFKPDDEPRSGNLACSGDLVGCLRRVQLRVAGAPTPALTDTDHVRNTMSAVQGRLWHDAMERELKKLGAEHTELRVSDYLPRGWGGRLDLLLPVEDKLRIVDFKFKDANALHRAQLTEAYEYQLTAYYHALAGDEDLPLDDTLAIYMFNRGPYVHKGQAPYAIHKFKPVMDKLELWQLMTYRRELVGAYKSEVKETGEYINRFLEGPHKPSQSLVELSAGHYELWQNPPWEVRYCEYGDLCACGAGQRTRIGTYHHEDGEWYFNYEYEGEVTVPQLGPPDMEAEELAYIQTSLVETLGGSDS